MPGCGMPLAYCELHHLAWWDRDRGLTNLANCAAYCSFHHHEIHRRDLRLTRNPDGTVNHHHPDGRPYGDAPPGDATLPAPEVRGRAMPAAESGSTVAPGIGPSGTDCRRPDSAPRPDRAPRADQAPPAGVDPPDDLLALLTG